MPNSFVYLGQLDAGSRIAKRLVEAGFVAAPDLAAAEIVVTYFPRVQDTEEALFGSEGVIAQAPSGAYVVNLGPVPPSFAKEISTMAQVSNLHAVEAPLFVSNMALSDAFARENLVAVVAGDSDDCQAMTQVLEAIAGRVEHAGQAGAAASAVCAAAFRRSAEVLSCMESDALLAFSEFGDRESAWALAPSLGASPAVVQLSEAVRNNEFAGAYTCEFLAGELEAAMLAAEEIGLTGPVSEACDYLVRLLCLIGGYDKTPAALTLLFQDEEAGAREGLNWEQAEQAYQHDHDHEHHHHDFEDFDALDEYSPN